MTIDNSKTLERIKILTELHGAPGFEDEVRSYMKSEMEKNQIKKTHLEL